MNRIFYIHSMKKMVFIPLFSWLFMAALSQSNQQAPMLKKNWIQNPGAEEDAWKPVKWEYHFPNDNLASEYGKTTHEWKFYCDEKCGLPKNAGSNYFRLETDVSAESTNHLNLFQNISLSPLKDSLDLGQTEAQLVGYVAGSPSLPSSCANFTIRLVFMNERKERTDSVQQIFHLKDFKDLDGQAGPDNPAGGIMHQFIPFRLTTKVPKGTGHALVSFDVNNNCADLADTSIAAFYFDDLNLAFYRIKP
jgi:hypothetical protein